MHVQDRAQVTSIKENLFDLGSKFESVQRNDIVGIEDILDAMDEIIDWLRNFEEYRRYSTRLEPGILFEGVPGSGKTLVSRYIATNSGAHFVNLRDYPISGQYISAEEIKDIFMRARAYYEKHHKPIILFWDEFEAVAKSRVQAKNAGEKTTSSELTAQLDGIGGKCPGILLIGCTNYRSQIDPALLRSGRMGLHINFKAPDREGKKILLDHYLSKFPSNTLDTETGSFFFEDEDTAAKVEEAAELVWRKTVTRALQERVEPVIDNDEMVDILLNNFLGMPGSFSKLSPRAQYETAIHELGHALVARAVGIPIRVITIRPYQDTIGRVITYMPDLNSTNVDEVSKMIQIAVGSLAAVKYMGLPPDAHSDSDTRYATDLALKISERWGQNDLAGFNPLGTQGYRGDDVYLAPQTLATLDEHVFQTLYQANMAAWNIINNYSSSQLESLAHQLVADTTWTGSQLESVLALQGS